MIYRIFYLDLEDLKISKFSVYQKKILIEKNLILDILS
jgi:hypothetical protein